MFFRALPPVATDSRSPRASGWRTRAQGVGVGIMPPLPTAERPRVPGCPVLRYLPHPGGQGLPRRGGGRRGGPRGNATGHPRSGGQVHAPARATLSVSWRWGRQSNRAVRFYGARFRCTNPNLCRVMAEHGDKVRLLKWGPSPPSRPLNQRVPLAVLLYLPLHHFCNPQPTG